MLLTTKVSEHFVAREFACHCGGKNAGCQVVLINNKLVKGLELLRQKYYPKGLVIVDAYRCPIENARAQKASGQRVIPNSQHVKGNAADIPGVATLAQVKALKVFTGIGYQKSTGLVTHVDVRPGRLAIMPTVWSYPLA